MNVEPFTLIITRVDTETWEAYAQRCNDIANYVAQRSAHLRSQSARWTLNGDDPAVRGKDWAEIGNVPAVEADFDKTMALFEEIEPRYSRSNRRLAEED